MAQQEKIIVFSGTTEGREYSKKLCEDKIFHIVCVATDYGKEVMEPSPYADIRVGRLNADEMAELFVAEQVTKVVDATHPFAAEVTENIQTALQSVKRIAENRAQQGVEREAENPTAFNEISYERVTREIASAEMQHVTGDAGTERKPHPLIDCADMAEAANFLRGTDGNILLTIGSKELKQFIITDEIKGRLYVRVLPAVESIESCASCGIERSHIIAMQGPFSVGMNVEMLRQYHIRWLVTKNTGKTGGFPEKLRAAEMTGCGCVVIQPPKIPKTEPSEEQQTNPSGGQNGISKEWKRDKGQRKYGFARYGKAGRGKELLDGNDSGIKNQQDSDKPFLKITLCGIGAGSETGMTLAVRQAIRSADVLFGSKRALDGRKGKIDTQEMYRVEDILAYICKFLQNTDSGIKHQLCVLFSGDTGFYSGCASVYEALHEELEKGHFFGSVTILPGVSSVAMLSARIGVPYQDAVLCSIHGKRKEDWTNELAVLLWRGTGEGENRESVGLSDFARESGRSSCNGGENKIIFILLSGKKNLPELKTLLLQHGQSGAEIYIGYNLFLKDEKVIHTTVAELDAEDVQEGLLTVCVIAEPADEKDCKHHREQTEAESSIKKENPSLPQKNKTDSIPIIGFADADFRRIPKLPMTKQEIRSIIFAKLELTKNAVFYDIGSGTGSIAVTAAASQGRLADASELRVLAFERNKEACELIRENAGRLKAVNLTVWGGEAPDIFNEIPTDLATPTHAFIGGSGGRLEEIYGALVKRNPAVRIVVTAITMETVQACYRLREKYGLENMETLQINIAREHALGRYHSMERGMDAYVFVL